MQEISFKEEHDNDNSNCVSLIKICDLAQMTGLSQDIILCRIAETLVRRDNFAITDVFTE